MAIIDVTKNRNVQHAVCEAIGGTLTLEQMNTIPFGHELDIVFTIHGVEIDFEKFITGVYGCFESSVNKRAQEMAMDAINADSRLQKIRDMFADVEWRVESAVREAFPSWESSGDC